MPADALFDKVSLLLHANGADGSTVFTDSSPRPKTPTVFGNAKISTAQSVFGGASAVFDGNGDYLQYADHADFEFGSGDFFIEARIRLSGYATANGGFYTSTIVGKDMKDARSFGLQLSGTANAWTALEFSGFADSVPNVYQVVSAPFNFALNTWYDVAVGRTGGKVYLFVNGVLLNAGGTAFTVTLQNASAPLRVGALEWDPIFKYYLPGNIDELRITKGECRHTATYAVATAPFPDGQYAFSGTVRNSVGAFAARTVRAHLESTGELVASTVSDAATGAYELVTRYPDPHTLVALPAAGETLNALVLANVVPM